MSMKNTFISFALAGLFIVAFFTFVITFQENNEVTDTIENDPIINKTLVNLNANMDTFDEQLESQSLNQDNDNPLTEGGSLLFLSITKAGKVVKGMVLGVYNVVIVIPSSLLGLPEFVVIVITAILTLILIFGAWRLYKAGE